MRKKSSFRKRLYQSMKFFFSLANLSHKMDEYFQVDTFVGSLGKLHFTQEGATEQEKRDFFISQLTDVELETHSYCNRTCSFCPNSQFNRLDKSQIMDEGIFKKIIDELSLLDFKGTLQLNRYNEPLALSLIFDRVAYARKQLIYANIGFHSNGDYVTKEKLKQLHESGLDFIAISRYIDFNAGRHEQIARARELCQEYIQNLGLEAEQVNDDGALIRYLVSMGKMKVFIFVGDAQNKWVDRGGILKEYANKTRVSPCSNPFRKIFIDYQGDVLPCCNLRADLDRHKPYILGNVGKSTLQEIFYSKAANKIRNNLVRFGEKNGVCKTCQFGVFSYNRQADNLINKTLKRFGLS